MTGRGRSAMVSRQFAPSFSCRRLSPGRGSGGGDGRTAGAVRTCRPHRHPVRHARPAELDRPRPGVRDRAIGKRPHPALRHRRHRLVRRRWRPGRCRGMGPRRDHLHARRQDQPLSGNAVRGRGQPPPRWRQAGDPVRGARGKRRCGQSRRRRAGDRPQPRQARLCDGSARGFARRVRRALAADCGGGGCARGLARRSAATASRQRP